MINDRNEDWKIHRQLWEMEHHSPLWPLYKSPDALRLVCERAIALGGLPSISAFTIVFDNLRNEGILKQLRQPRPPEAPELTAEIYSSMSASEVVRRYGSDQAFRDCVDSLIANGKI